MHRPRILHPLVATFILLGLGSTVAEARDELEAIVRKDKLSASDRATIESEVNRRARRLEESAGKARQLREARDILTATAKVSKASADGLQTYAEAVTQKLSPLAATHDLALGLEVVEVLAILNHPATAEALAAALTSPNSAVRLRAAVAIRNMHSRLLTDRAACRMVLSALGRAGATEKNDVTLRGIYGAISFGDGAPSAQLDDEIAAALCEIFPRRSAMLQAGSGDEWADTPGFEAAGRVFANAADARKKQLVSYLLDFLERHVDRYASPDTAPEYIPTLAAATRALEQTLRTALQSANLSAPSTLASAKMSERRTDASRKAVQSALSDWREAFSKSPWAVP